MIIAVDFDGTVVEHAFPHIGEPLPFAFEVLNGLQKKGHKLIMWTCRENEDCGADYLDHAITFCNDHGLSFDSYNNDHPHGSFRKGIARKVYADVYIDDRNFGGFPGWEAVAKFFNIPL